jgi:hypothetical protein
MAEKENSAFRLHRFIERMLSQPPNILTAEVLVNAFGVKKTHDVWSQNELVLRVGSLLFAELHSLKEESGRAGFTTKSLEPIEGAFGKLSVSGLTVQWQHNSPVFKACLTPLHIFGEGLADEGAPISKADLIDLQDSISKLRENVQKSDLRADVKNFVYEQLDIIERAINNYPLVGMKAFRAAVREGMFHEAEHMEIVTELQKAPQMPSLQAIVAKVAKWSGYAMLVSRLLSAGEKAEKGVQALAPHAHHIGLWIRHLLN